MIKEHFGDAGQSWYLPGCSQLEAPFCPEASLLQLNTEEMQQDFLIFSYVNSPCKSRRFTALLHVQTDEPPKLDLE